MGRYVTLHALLAGFFAFAAVHYFTQWYWSRRESVLALFSLLCALGMGVSLVLFALAQAATIAQAQAALDARTTLALVWVGASLPFISRVTGLRAIAFARTIMGLLLVAALANFFIPLNGVVTGIETVQTPWGPVRTKAGKPEYEDCARIGREHNIPLRAVYESIQRPV